MGENSESVVVLEEGVSWDFQQGQWLTAHRSHKLEQEKTDIFMFTDL
jgi:hypothetical protein